MVMQFPGNRIKALTLSYDDGVVYDIRLIEIMKRYGVKGTFNVNSGSFSGRALSKEQVKELYHSNGMELAAHGLYHQALNMLHNPHSTYEVFKDRENLEALTGSIIRGFAYAFGNFGDVAIDALKAAGFAYARTTVSTEKFDIPTDWLRMPATCHHQNPKLLQLAESFLDDEAMIKKPWTYRPKLFYLWGHSYEFNDNNNWELIEEFFEKVARRDDVWYATNIEIYEYVTAFNSLVLSLDSKIVYNPSAIPVCVRQGGKDFTIDAGQTIKF